MNKRIVFKYNDVGVLYFPAGSIDIGGTCEFATENCLKYCPEIANNRQPHYDTYNFIVKNDVEVVFNKIKKDLFALDKKVLTWFAAGDCMMKGMNHILDIMVEVSMVGIVQHGFTRNVSLWEKAQGIQNMYLALTVESKKDKLFREGFGRVVIPDYEKDMITLYQLEEVDVFEPKEIAMCSGVFWADVLVGSELRESNCSVCYDNLEGCFKSKKC